MRYIKIFGILILLCILVLGVVNIVINRSADFSIARETQTMNLFDKSSNKKAAVPSIDTSIPSRIETATFALG